MSSIRVGWGAFCVALVACTAGASEVRIQPELEQVARRRIFFGHQSVGKNVLDGLGALAAREGVTLRIADARPGTGVPAATLGHAFLAENGDPLRKLRSFREAFDSGAARGAEIALMKFCYVDVDASTDVERLFAEYQRTIAELQARHPDTTFVHVTVPLVTLPAGVRTSARRILGDPAPPRALANGRRDRYNALLRTAYAGREPVFDLARVESTGPGGAEERQVWQGRPFPALSEAYSDDGGHLNAAGRAAAARALVAVLAGVPPLQSHRDSP